MDTGNAHPATDAYDGWRLGTQAYTFNRFTFFDAIDKTASLGLGWIEAYPGQKLGIKSSDGSDAVFDPNMPKELRQQVKSRLNSAGVRVVNYGVVPLPNDEEKCRIVFDFAKDMGIETIVSEPTPETFDLIDRLCKEYKIKVAVHNHPKPSRYWNPDTVLEVCKDRSPWIGACADTGHWVRSGLEPLDCLKKLQGRIISLHFKEIDQGHDVIWGQGKARAKELLAELDRQKFSGVFSIEYEYNWENSVPEIRQCVAFFDQTAGKIKPSGWRNLLADDLSNAEFKPASWIFEEGLLTLVGGGDIWTKDKFSDFVLDMQFRLDEKTNSGVFIRTGNHEWLPWVEVQVEDSFEKPVSKHICGAIFDVLEPSANVVKPAGQWNRLTITAQGTKVDVVINGEHIIDMNLDRWTQAGKNPDGTNNKFNIAYKDLPRAGFIGLQDHGSKVWYRNLRIRELPKEQEN